MVLLIANDVKLQNEFSLATTVQELAIVFLKCRKILTCRCILHIEILFLGGPEKCIQLFLLALLIWINVSLKYQYDDKNE